MPDLSTTLNGTFLFIKPLDRNNSIFNIKNTICPISSRKTNFFIPLIDARSKSLIQLCKKKDIFQLKTGSFYTFIPFAQNPKIR